MDFPGPICQTLGICCEDVRNRSLQKLDSLNNGLVLEINEFCKKENLTVQQIVEVLGCLNDNFINANAKAVHSAHKDTACCRTKKEAYKQEENQGV
jgi:hypothetical protein